MRTLRILYIGPDYPGSNATCWRNAFRDLGHDVFTIDDEKIMQVRESSLGKIRRRVRKRPPQAQIERLNDQILTEARRFRPELCFYAQARNVLPDTLEATRKLGPNFAYMNDDMFAPGVASFTFPKNIRQMDCIVTTKSYSVREYHSSGAPLAVYLPNAYDPAIHYPAQPSIVERAFYQGDLGFIGDFHTWKADFLSELAHRASDFKFNVWGRGWQKITRPDNWIRWRRWRRLKPCVRGQALWCAEMGKAIQSTKIMLGLVLRHVRDLHTSRSFEIPACGGFMLAERTEEHRMYFEEDKEAVYFGSLQELLDKARFYISREDLRNRIAQAGYERCIRSKATYKDRAVFVLEQYHKLTKAIFPGGCGPAAAPAVLLANGAKQL